MTKISDANTLIFLVGLGAPIEIYNNLIKKIREEIPHETFHAVEWWTQEDFGKNEIQGYLKNTKATLIGHSAGGSMAINALVHSPDSVHRVVMLDSHAPKGSKPLPSIEKFLDIILSPDGGEVIEKVRRAYVPVIEDSAAFDRAFRFLTDWVKTDLPKIGSAIKAMRDHTVLHMGFTDSEYKVLDSEHQHELKELWGQYNFDTQFLRMSHFELITASNAELVSKKILSWIEG